MRNSVHPHPDGKVTASTVEGAANTAATITLAAAADTRHVLHAIQYSYAGTITTAGITVSVAGSDVFDIDVTIKEGTIEFHAPIYTSENEAMVITIKAGGGTSVGKLNTQTS